jgi:hypothetical protein
MMTPTGNIGSQALRNLLAAGEKPELLPLIPPNYVRKSETGRDDIGLIRRHSRAARAMDGVDALFWRVPTRTIKFFESFKQGCRTTWH